MADEPIRSPTNADIKTPQNAQGEAHFAYQVDELYFHWDGLSNFVQVSWGVADPEAEHRYFEIDEAVKRAQSPVSTLIDFQLACDTHVSVQAWEGFTKP